MENQELDPATFSDVPSRTLQDLGVQGDVANGRRTNRVKRDEPGWHATLAVIVALALYVTLPPKLTFGPVWIAPALVGALLIPLSILAPYRREESKVVRAASLVLIAILNVFNAASVVLLIHEVVFVPHGHKPPDASQLFVFGAQIWTTNILVFGLWYWELDSGGPGPRAEVQSAMRFRKADFLFPQMSRGGTDIACVDETWKPMLLDYMYIAFTNALAFSPADTMPLSRMAKMLMTIEATISFITIAFVFARAIGIIQ